MEFPIKRIGNQVFFYKSVSSTNDVAKQWAQEEAHAEGAVFIAESQTNGRGRMSRAWFDSQGSLLFSLLLRPNCPPPEAPGLTLVLAVAVCRALQPFSPAPLGIKWPNDIIANGRKLCGILLEADYVASTLRSVVAGIGVNVNTAFFPPDLRDRATSLLLLSGKAQNKATVLKSLLGNIETCYNDSYRTHGLAPFVSGYESLCLTLGQDVTLTRGGVETCAKAVSLSPDGGLVVAYADGSTGIVHSGEVSLRGKTGYCE